MIEQLFAQQGQGKAFLVMLAGGMAVAALFHVATFVRKRWRFLAVPGDISVALALLTVLLMPFVTMDTPLRLYGLLGVALGAALYAAGMAPMAEALCRKVKKCLQRRPQKEGNPLSKAKK